MPNPTLNQITRNAILLKDRYTAVTDGTESSLLPIGWPVLRSKPESASRYSAQCRYCLAVSLFYSSVTPMRPDRTEI